MALLLGSGAALLWTLGALVGARGSRLAGASRVMLWSMLIGAGVPALLALPNGLPEGTGSQWAFLAATGTAYTIGTGMMLVALGGGHVSIVMPIIACDGGVAAMLAAATGSPLAPIEAVLLTSMVLGVVLVASSGRRPNESVEAANEPWMRPLTQTVAAAGLSAAAFGVVFWGGGKASGMDPLWVTSLSRVIPLLAAFAICLRQRAIRPPRAAWPWILTFGIADAVGFLFYLEGSRFSIPVAAVAASQYAALAVIGGIVAYGEHLSRVQAVGVGLLVVAAALLTVAGL